MNDTLTPLQRLRFTFQAIEPIRLPEYSGSAWRGLLGRGLRRSACVTRAPTCSGCLLAQQCSYSVFFESLPTDSNDAGRYTALPHPYVLEPEIGPRRAVEPGETLQLGVNVMGPAIDLVPYLIHALRAAGELGLGRQGGRFLLHALHQEKTLGGGDWQLCYSPDDTRHTPAAMCTPQPPHAPSRVSLLLETPMRIKHRGHFVGAGDLTPGLLLKALGSRQALLAKAYGSGETSLDAKRVARACAGIQSTGSDLRWHEWTRYSSRQSTAMNMGGLVGRLDLAGDGLAAIWPLLWYGQWMLVGKGTSFGLGRYRIVRAAG